MIEDTLRSDFEIKKAHVRWAIPQRVDFMTFIGREVLAIAHDVYIIFFNFKDNTEHVYEANCYEQGDGVDVIAGHKTNTFAFAEKCKAPRILVITYPSLKIVAELKDLEANRYKALAMMENELLAGFTGFPQYALSVWSWRSRQRLLSIPTSVVRRTQIIVPSRTHLLIGQCWDGGINVWEVTQCHKVALVMKRPLEEATGWEVSDPPLTAICWSNDGQLYAIDENAYLYSLLSDGVGLVKQLEWSENIDGQNTTCMCSYNSGMLIYGPDNCVRAIKKSDTTKWTVSWLYRPRDVVIKLVSNFVCDLAVMWTEKGFVYKITTESEDKIDSKLIAFKQRNIKKIQLLAPNYTHVVTLDESGALCLYEVMTGKLETVKYIREEDITLQASPIDSLLVVIGSVGPNYGLALLKWERFIGLHKVGDACLTHQIVSRATFSPDGRILVVSAMSAGDIFIYNLSEDCQLNLITYTELGCSLVDCFLMQVGEVMRLFCLVLFSDKYAIGEWLICINAETGGENMLEGKVAGPYSQLVALDVPGKALAVPHLSTQMHLLEFTASNEIVHVKMDPVMNTGHELKQYNIVCNRGIVLTYGYDGAAIFQHLDHTGDKDDLKKLVVSHRYEAGVKEVCIDKKKSVLVHLANHRTCAVHLLQSDSSINEVTFEPPDPLMFEEYYNDTSNVITIFNKDAKNYLDEEEEKKIEEEEIASKKQREEITIALENVRTQLVDLLEKNLQSNEPECPQLPLSEFLLHSEYKRDRLKQAEKEREQIQLETEARIQALDKVSDWIKKHCWDVILTPRTKLYAIFSHHQVENYAVLPTQRENWPELQQIEALRIIEMENDHDLFRPEEEQMETMSIDEKAFTSQTTEKEGWKSLQSQTPTLSETEISEEGNPYMLAGSTAHDFVEISKIMIPQTMSYSFLHMNWLQHIVKLNVQNIRLWFNKEFDDMMNQKKREMSHVEDINSRLRFIVQELNTLSDLRGSFNHLTIRIQDPEWLQEEQPEKLITVEPEEVSIPPYISPSQIVIPPPEPQPKDDFRERALKEMMDGVLEKLWHEEIKKPIPLPQCMIEKDPEHFNEDDLREVFDYEAKVAFRNEERDKYRKMLHAEYAKLSQTLNESIAKFNQKVKELWLTKLKVDSIMGQENLNLMRLRRVNLDRVESAEKIEDLRLEISKYEAEGEMLQQELITIQSNTEQCQAIYEGLVQKEKQQDKAFKNHFVDVSPVVSDQCYKFYKRRPKWQTRGNLTPAALQEMATAVVTGVRPPLMHPDCLDFLKTVDQLDHISNMPPVMDETVWSTMCKLRRAKIENEIRLRAMSAELSCAESAANVWRADVAARRSRAARARARVLELRQATEHDARNRTLQLVLPAGQVEIVSTGHIEDFDDAILLPRDEIEEINNVILQVGELKLKMMRQQVEFRKGILTKEWEHAQMKMKLRHMEQELASYRRLKLPKELQWYLKNKTLGRTDEQEYIRMEKEIEASKVSVNRELTEYIKKVEEVELKKSQVEAQLSHLDTLIGNLNAKVSEKKLNEDPLMPIKIRNAYKERMETLVMRSKLIREVQANHTRIVLLQTELELLRLKTYPTLATFRTLDT